MFDLVVQVRDPESLKEDIDALVSSKQKPRCLKAFKTVSTGKHNIISMINNVAVFRMSGVYTDIQLDVFDPSGKRLVVEDVEVESAKLVDIMYGNFVDAVADGAQLTDQEFTIFHKKITDLLITQLI